ncbi:hypothetical protein RUM43_012012, partial [Polyplax serrata]
MRKGRGQVAVARADFAENEDGHVGGPAANCHMQVAMRPIVWEPVTVRGDLLANELLPEPDKVTTNRREAFGFHARETHVHCKHQNARILSCRKKERYSQMGGILILNVKN